MAKREFSLQRNTNNKINFHSSSPSWSTNRRIDCKFDYRSFQNLLPYFSVRINNILTVYFYFTTESITWSKSQNSFIWRITFIRQILLYSNESLKHIISNNSYKQTPKKWRYFIMNNNNWHINIWKLFSDDDDTTHDCLGTSS